MKNLIKFAGIFGQVFGAVFGEGVNTAGTNTFDKYPYFSYST